MMMESIEKNGIHSTIQLEKKSKKKKKREKINKQSEKNQFRLRGFVLFAVKREKLFE